MDFLEQEAQVAASGQILHHSEYHWDLDGVTRVSKGMNALELASYFGIDRAVHNLLQKDSKLE
jgi:hypothetical protein